MLKKKPHTHRESYYEAILQLRPANKKVFDFVSKLVNERKVHVSRIDELKSGIDIYLSDKHFTVDLGKKLKKKFGGKTVLSRKLYSWDRQTSKKKWRVTVCFRLEDDTRD